MTSLHIRLAELSDAPAVAGLVRAGEIHYVGPDVAPIERTLAMVEASMKTQEGTRYALAFLDGEPVGLACFAIIRPGSRLSGLFFVKELFVDERARGAGIGETMLNWLAALAREQGIGRIDLTTDGSNARAQAFYERLGGARMDKVFYRFDLKSDVLGEG